MSESKNLHPIADHPAVQEELKACEGFRSMPYNDHLGKLTIGYGTLLEDGITKKEAEAMMKVHHSEMLKQFEDIMGWDLTDETKFPPPVAMSLANMVYQLGPTKLANFKQTMAAIARQDWSAAADEGLNSRWAKQTPQRANKMMDRIRNCK